MSRRTMVITLAAGVVLMSASGRISAQRLSATPLSPEAAQWFAHVQFLASDDLQGRLIGTPGCAQAADYVADQYKKASLKSAGKDGYFQQVPFDSVQIDTGASSLHAEKNGQTTSFKIGSEAILSPHADADTDIEAEAVFAGYGLSIPARHIDYFAMSHDRLACRV